MMPVGGSWLTNFHRKIACCGLVFARIGRVTGGIRPSSAMIPPATWALPMWGIHHPTKNTSQNRDNVALTENSSLHSPLQSCVVCPPAAGRMHLYSLTLQKSTAITVAVYGSFSAPKMQEIAVGRGGQGTATWPWFEAEWNKLEPAVSPLLHQDGHVESCVPKGGKMHG